MEAYPSASGSTECCGGRAEFALEQMTNISSPEGCRDRFPPLFDRVPAALRGWGACVGYLFAARWPEGFVCPGCAASKAWQLQTKRWTWEGAGCGRQTSVTAGTIMHPFKLPLTTWFWAAYLMATHSHGISALQRQRRLAPGSYKSAWLLCGKLRASMVVPGRTPLAGLVEVDETEIPCRSRHDPVTGGGGRSRQGKILLVGAVEVQDGGAGPGRIRLAEMPDCSAASLHPFIALNLAPGATAKTDGWPAYPGAPGVSRDAHVIGKMAAHVVLPWVHRIFSNLKVWALGVDHGLRRKHVQAYLATNSSSASTAAAPDMPPSAPCSASPPATHRSPSRC